MSFNFYFIPIKITRPDTCFIYPPGELPTLPLLESAIPNEVMGLHGAVSVVSEHHNLLTLVSTDGTTYYFNVPARRFVASPTEVVPSSTPPPTYTPHPLPGTVIPYPAPTEQSTVAP